MRRVFLVQWQGGNAKPKLMQVEAEFGWQAVDYAKEYLQDVYGYKNPDVRVLEYLVNGDNGVEDIS